MGEWENEGGERSPQPLADISRIRNLNSTALITFDASSEHRFSSLNLGVHSAMMGKPLSGGAFSLHPEEAIFLAESALAIIRAKNGRPMALEECFNIMAREGVSMEQFIVYATCKRAGFAVRRSSERKRRAEGEHAEAESCKKKSEREQQAGPSGHSILPRHFLDAFPSIGDGRRSFLHELHPELTPIDGVASYSSKNKQFAPSLPVGGKRGGGKYNPSSLRPRHWPALFSLSQSATSWQQYAEERRRLLQRNRGPGRSVAPPSSSGIVYHLYSPLVYTHSTYHRFPPAHSVEIARGGGSGMGVPSGSRHLTAFVRGPLVNFIDQSGASINLFEIQQR